MTKKLLADRIPISNTHQDDSVHEIKLKNWQCTSDEQNQNILHVLDSDRQKHEDRLLASHRDLTSVP